MSEETETLEQKIEELKTQVAFFEGHVHGLLDQAKQYVGMQAQFEKQLSVLQAELDKQKSAVGMPKTGEVYFSPASSGEIYHYKWAASYADEGRFASGNVFPTKEAAERERDRRILIADMRRWAAENGVSVTWRPLVRDPISFKLAREMSDLFDDRLHLLND